uniref:transposase n=1 Tax=Pseudomonas saliphila TaxID=2586906 RepID=UPI00123B33B7
IEGIGDLTAMALANTFHRGPFKTSDAFIAFLGMDVRVRDSGKQKGRRKLTKKGDPELRRLLYNAAMAARKTQAWKGVYEAYIAQGLKPIQALVKLARKLARIAFALMQNQTTYQPKMA